MPRLQGRIDLDGAIINIGVEVVAVDAADLLARGLPIPAPFQTTALLDTGASRTALHSMIIQSLGLTSRGFMRVGTPGTVPRNVLLYDVRIALGFLAPLISVEAPAITPATTSVLVLIGRDVLEHCALYFDGQNKSFSLWF